MKIKPVLTVILLVFIAASVVTFLVKQKSPGSETALSQPEANVVVYYFHGNKRCVTCKTIEAYAREAIENNFEKEIEQGKLVFKSVNLDIPGNEHYIQDYQLTVKTVIVARYINGKQVEWKDLDQVWKLVPDKPAYLEYVQSGTRELLEHV